MVGNLLLEGGYVGGAIADGQTDFEVFPIYEKGYIIAGLGVSVYVYNKLKSPVGAFGMPIRRV